MIFQDKLPNLKNIIETKQQSWFKKPIILSDKQFTYCLTTKFSL